MELIQSSRPLYWPEVVYKIQEVLADVPEVYLVGGAVRDAYRGALLHDIDLACPKDGRPIARKIANEFKGAYYALDLERGVGRAIIEYQGVQIVVDVAALRGDLEADLRDRDFSMNAIAVPLGDEDLNHLYDPCGGVGDLQKKILRRCSPNSIANDPIRALRGIRQSLKYGVHIEPETRQDIKTYGVKLVESSSERVRDEIFALLGNSKPQSGLAALEMLGLLKLVVPEIERLQAKNVWRYTLTCIEKMDVLLTVMSPRRDDNLAANAGFGAVVYLLDRYRDIYRPHLVSGYPDERTHRMLLMFVLLMMLAGDDPESSAKLAAERARSLKLSNQEIKQLEAAILMYRLPVMLPDNPDARQVYRFWREAGTSGIDACLVAMVNYLAEKGVAVEIDDWTRYLQTIASLFEGYNNAINLTPVVSGTDLIEHFEMERGPKIGEVLEMLREAQALGEISTKEDGLALAEKFLKNPF